MPDIFVYVSEDDAKLLAPHLGESGGLASALKKATAKTFVDLDGPQDVEVRLIVQAQSSGATRVQIYAVASLTSSRRKNVDSLIRGWARELAKAWSTYLQGHNVVPPKLYYEFPLSGVGIWPTMPEGQWFLASDAAVGRFN